MLDIMQSVALMAFAANGVSDMWESSQKLNEYFKIYLEGNSRPPSPVYTGFFPTFNSPLSSTRLIGGDWRVVWGPVAVLRDNSSKGYAANSAYVAFSPSQATYVVAIAGTNPASVYDVIWEDGDVTYLDLVNWPIGNPSSNGAQISGGTYNGLMRLQSMRNSAGVPLIQFLNSVQNKSSRLIFAGHSLGGALAPTLALYLYPEPSSTGWSSVVVLPIAGPTPGTVPFADLWNSKYRRSPAESKNYPHFNCNFTNPHDVVPRAWNRLQSVLSQDGIINRNGDTVYKSIWGYINWYASVPIQNTINAGNDLITGVTYGPIASHQFEKDLWGYFYPGPLFPLKPWRNPQWNPWPEYTENNPITYDDIMYSDVFCELVISTHLDAYFKYFDVVPIQPLPRSSQMVAAQQSAERKRRLMIATAKLSSATGRDQRPLPNEGSAEPPHRDSDAPLSTAP